MAEDRPGEDLIRSLVVLAHERSFGRAAQVEGVTADTIARRVRRLEELVGTPLLHHSTRQFALTEAGETLASAAADALGALDLAVRGARVAARVDLLTIDIAPDLAGAWSAPVEAWATARPGDVRIDLSTPDRAFQAVLSGTLDIAVLPGEISHPHAETVGNAQVFALVPDEHPAARLAAIRPGDLDGLAFVVTAIGDDAPRRESVARATGDPDHPAIVAALRGTMGAGMLAAARAHRAATVALEHQLVELDTSTFTALPFAPGWVVPIAVVWSAAVDPATARGLAEHLRSR
jgi:DNA-binding transcriptional LysR family regulator